METFTMSRKELPRPGLMKTLLTGRITNQQAAAALHVGVRQVQRLKRRFEAEGVVALRHGSRDRPSPRRLTDPVREQIQTLMQTVYDGFNDSHLTEKLRELHSLAVSRESVRRLRRALGRPPTRRRRAPKHRQRRPREDAVGALVQIDGSPFDWLEGRGPAMTLLGAIDDASSQVLALHFRPTEDLHGYATIFQQTFLAYGLPLALYGDGIGILYATILTGAPRKNWPAPSTPRTSAACCASSASATSRPARPKAKAASNGSGGPCRIASSVNCGCAASRPVRRPTPSCPSSSPTSIGGSPSPRPSPRPSGARPRATLIAS
jgi:transposase